MKGVLTLKAIKLDCTYEERISEKTQKPYKAIFIKLSDKYEKTVFVSYPEEALIDSINNIESTESLNNVFESFK